MPTDLFNGIINDLCKLSINRSKPCHIYLIGGDPLLHPNLLDFAKTIYTSGLSFSIKGNPFPKSATKLIGELKQL